MQPAFVYNFELSYGFKDYLQAKVYYQNIQDDFGQIAFHQEQELDGKQRKNKKSQSKIL